jgi:hypothetical protein
MMSLHVSDPGQPRNTAVGLAAAGRGWPDVWLIAAR